MKRRSLMLTASAGAAVGVVGLVALALPAGAGAAPVLPQVAPEDLVQSVISATPPAFSGTVEVDNALGLPTIPGEGQLSGMLSNGSSHFQVWADGHGRERLAVPSATGETTVVNDGMTVWEWDSVKRTVTESTQTKRNTNPQVPADPATAARQIVGALQQSSTVAVDGTGTEAGRPAYELVLTPKPTERTLLRQVRIAVDAQRRIPLAVEVDTNGSSDPALKVGFSQLDMTAPNPSLFQFTPPPGAKVQQQRQPDTQRPQQPQVDHKIVGNGWDTVLVTNLPPQMSTQQAQGGRTTDPRALVQRIGTPTSGSWGQGWVISTKAVTALVTSDGRLAVGAVPEQVLAEALGNSR